MQFCGGESIYNLKAANEELSKLRHELQSELAKKTEELDDSNINLLNALSVREDFLSVASHELKTPLTSMKIQTQMLKRSILKEDPSILNFDRLRKLVECDERQINRVTRLIDNMLDIVRIASGKLIVNPASVDLCSIVQEVAERTADQFSHAGCQLFIESCGAAEGYGDRFRLEQVVTNLVNNAIKYGAGKSIQMSIKTEGDKAVLQVQDQGIGIARFDHERIFRQFERAVNSNEVSGLGLGLYIVKQILDAHHGTIRVESELGRGANFIVELPLQITKT
jgi:signal transduction histidine kinase